MTRPGAIHLNGGEDRCALPEQAGRCATLIRVSARAVVALAVAAVLLVAGALGPVGTGTEGASRSKPAYTTTSTDGPGVSGGWAPYASSELTRAVRDIQTTDADLTRPAAPSVAITPATAPDVAPTGGQTDSVPIDGPSRARTGSPKKARAPGQDRSSQHVRR